MLTMPSFYVYLLYQQKPSERDTKLSVRETEQSVRVISTRLYQEQPTERQTKASVWETKQSAESTSTKLYQQQPSERHTKPSVQETQQSGRATSTTFYQQQPTIGDNTPKVVGSICVASVKINDVTAATLLDTGFQVSIISQSFYNQHFYNREIKPLIDIDVECANGNSLAYLGYITAPVDLVGASTSRTLLCSMLVAPDNKYNIFLPILLATNVLQTAMGGVRRQFGRRFLKDANIHPPWDLPCIYMLLREKECL